MSIKKPLLLSTVPYQNLTLTFSLNLLIPILFLLQVTKEICRKPKTLSFILPFMSCFVIVIIISIIIIEELAKRHQTRGLNSFFFYSTHSTFVFWNYTWLTVLTIPKKNQSVCVKQTRIWRHQSFYMISGYGWLTMGLRPKKQKRLDLTNIAQFLRNNKKE